MADSSNAEEQLLGNVLDSYQQPVRRNASMKRRYRRSRSAPESVSFSEQSHNPPPHQPHSSCLKKFGFFTLVLLLLILYIGVGALCFYLLRHDMKGHKTNGIIDAVYFCIVTMTTVGYGDLVPDNTVAKILSCVYVFSGMVLVGVLLSKAADKIVENQEIRLVKAMHLHEHRCRDEVVKEVEANKVKYKLYILLVLLIVLVIAGTVFLHRNQGLDVFDAFYVVCVTITTLGYGDKSFSTSTGRVFAAIWILMSTLCLAQFFVTLVELYTERRMKSMVRRVLARKLTVSDLEAADLDNDEVVSASEFVIYKLKEMGKISDEDVAMVMELFKVLDVDQSGTLTKDDLVNRASM